LVWPAEVVVGLVLVELVAVLVALGELEVVWFDEFVDAVLCVLPVLAVDGEVVAADVVVF
jgi:hypothetical protein